tara:strand:+ start:70 stop:1038 length:969 start_codon:yes stop_codon:yes gene_type:complete
MNRQNIIKSILFLLVVQFSTDLKAQIIFDYSGAELVLEHFTEGTNNIEKIVKNAGYQHILNHSKKYSSNPLNEENLINSLNGKNEGFDFSKVKQRKDTLLQIINYLKENEKKIFEEYAVLPTEYLPNDYKQKATIYIVIGGYNGIAFDDKICINIDYQQFRRNQNEIDLYIAHELFHIGFEKYQRLPDIFNAKTVKDLREIVLTMTMNEGLATLTPYHKRVAINQLNDYDYKVLLDSLQLNEKLNQFENVMSLMNNNLDKEITNEILSQVLGQCSGDRLFYIVGCEMGLKIEEKYGKQKLKQLIELGADDFFMTYNNILNEE